mgnify:CR=1 FL=1
MKLKLYGIIIKMAYRQHFRRLKMAASYKKLWKLLIDKDMRKEDLRLKAGITTTAMAKLGRNETVHMDILLKICNALNCGLDDILEIVSEEKND